MSRHQKVCSDTNFRSPCSLCATKLRAMSRHPNGCPRHDMKIMSRPRTNLVPASATSRYKIDIAIWGPGSVSCAHQNQIVLAAALSRASRSVTHLACELCSARQALPVATPFLGRDLAPKMGSSPSHSVLALFFSFPFCSTHCKTSRI